MNNTNNLATEEIEKLHELLRQSTHEIYELAEVTNKLCEGEEGAASIHGMMARIKTLTEIVFYSHRLIKGDTKTEINLNRLECVYKGMIG